MSGDNPSNPSGCRLLSATIFVASGLRPGSPKARGRGQQRDPKTASWNWVLFQNQVCSFLGWTKSMRMFLVRAWAKLIRENAVSTRVSLPFGWPMGHHGPVARCQQRLLSHRFAATRAIARTSCCLPSVIRHPGVLSTQLPAALRAVGVATPWAMVPSSPLAMRTKSI